MKFMVCYNEADPSGTILKEACRHARAWNASLEVVKTVTRELPLKHTKIVTMEAELEARVKEQITEAGVPYNVQLLMTSLEAGEQLVKFSDETEVDLIFIGVVKKSKVGKLFFGSTAQYVILHAVCPVVTVNV